MEDFDLQDDYLKKLLRKNEPEKPAVDFTARLMKTVLQLEAEKTRNPWWSWNMLWWALVSAAMILILSVILFPFVNFSIPSFINIDNDPERVQRTLSLVLDSFRGFLLLIDYLRESNLAIIVITIIPALFLIDQLFRRISSRSFLFNF